MSVESSSGQANSTVSDNGFLWEQYLVYVDLFKLYVDNALRPCVWFYAITGVLLSFYVDRIKTHEPYLPFTLLLPILFSIGFCVIYLRAVRQVEDMRAKLDYIREQLGLLGSPHVGFLSDFLRLAGVLFGLVGAALLVLFFLGLASL